jgi:hypothetical protein
VRDEVLTEIRQTLLPFFQRYDTDRSEHIDTAELHVLLHDLHVQLGRRELSAFIAGGGAGGARGVVGCDLLGIAADTGGAASADTGGSVSADASGPVSISFDDFVKMVISYVRASKASLRRLHRQRSHFRQAEAVLLREATAGALAPAVAGAALAPGVEGAPESGLAGEEEDEDEGEEDHGDEMPAHLNVSARVCAAVPPCAPCGCCCASLCASLSTSLCVPVGRCAPVRVYL